MDEIIRINDPRRADIRFQDGALPHLRGVKSFQILRCNRKHPEWADDIGWTYNHAAMIAHAYGYYFCEYLSNPVDEHETPGHTMLTRSRDGQHWEKPLLLFPEVMVPTWQYKGPRSPMLQDPHLTCAHQRMGFYQAKNGVLLALAFYGLVHDRHLSAPCDGWGVGRVVRRILPDGTPGEGIYFLIYNEPAGYTRENIDVFPFYADSPDADFIAACRECLNNGAVVRQMYEEQRFDKTLFPNPGEQALSFYTVRDDEMIGVYKKGMVAVSHDQGQTWSDCVKQPTIVTATGKVWGQRTSDDRYTLMYNPTTDGQHRWPIAAVTGEDGHRFGDMSAVTGDMSPQRYGGIDKNLGPQYMRGIAECNEQSPDGDVWLAYTNNKEDVWVSRIPVPLTHDGAAEGCLTLRPGELPVELGVYAPVWCPVEAEDGALLLWDRDPFDHARAEVATARATKGTIRFTVDIASLSAGAAFTFEVQDDTGRTPIRLVFKPDGTLYVRGDGRTDPWKPFPTGEKIPVEITFDCESNRYTVRALGQEKSCGFSAAVDDLTRFRFMTKEVIPHLSTDADCGKWGTRDMVLPGCEEPTEESIIRLSDISWACR